MKHIIKALKETHVTIVNEAHVKTVRKIRNEIVEKKHCKIVSKRHTTRIVQRKSISYTTNQIHKNQQTYIFVLSPWP